MENNNTFNPPVDTGEPTPSPAESPNPTSPEEPESASSPADQPSEEHGYTSNEQGYGVSEDGTDKTKEDLSVDPDYFNDQAHRGAEALYAAAEDEMTAENEAFENAWNAEDEEKEKADRERVLRALADAKADIETAVSIMSKSNNAKKPTPPSDGAPAIPVANSEPLSSTAVRDIPVISTPAAGSEPLSSTAVRDILTVSVPAANNAENSEPNQNFIGNSAEDTNNSSED